jgi:hypothetical protein
MRLRVPRIQLALFLALVLAVAVSAALVTRRNTAAHQGERGGTAAQSTVHQNGISVEFQGAEKKDTVIDAEWYQDQRDVRAHVHARVPGKQIFYDAFAADPADVQLAIDEDLSRATLKAAVRIERCMDSNGNGVTVDCPVGKVFGVEGSWFGTAKMESWRAVGEEETNLVRGRLGEARITLDGVLLGTSPYAEIVTNHITPGGRAVR